MAGVVVTEVRSGIKPDQWRLFEISRVVEAKGQRGFPFFDFSAIALDVQRVRCPRLSLPRRGYCITGKEKTFVRPVLDAPNLDALPLFWFL